MRASDDKCAAAQEANAMQISDQMVEKAYTRSKEIHGSFHVVDRDVIRTALEAALSDAEAVIEIAPAVTVKALNWFDGTAEYDDLGLRYILEDGKGLDEAEANGWYALEESTNTVIRADGSPHGAMLAVQLDFEQRILSALSAQVQDMTRWQNFSTVPKDGTVVDLWHKEFGRFPDCYWGKPTHECGEAGCHCDSDWHSEADGWVSSTFNSSIFNEGWTHWMKLAAMPVTKHGDVE
jgi:hypothetical protein